MTISSPDTPPADVPEADWAEQAVAVDPVAEEGEPAARPTHLDQGTREVNEADLAEQETAVFDDDEDARR